MKDKPSRKSEKKLFAAGCAAGALLFILFYGWRVLDFTNDAWIFSMGDIDIRQHYLGFAAYRNSPWYFPPGLGDGLSYPYKMSVLWTDSIPLLAFFFKLFRDFLPETFQYLGWFGFISFILNGGFSAVLLWKAAGDSFLALSGSIFYITAFPVLHRMFYHTSLTAHWLIFLPLIVLLDRKENASLPGSCLFGALYCFTAVAIHPYLWAMGTFILALSVIYEGISRKSLRSVVLPLSAMAGSTLLGLYLEGAFYGRVDAAYGVGGFESNLNAFFNNMGLGALLPPLPLASGFQYEGFAYLGAGLLILTSMAFFYALYAAWHRRGAGLKAFLCSNQRFALCAFAGICFFGISIYPGISFGESTLLRLQGFGWFNRLLNIFRSNGRFIWPCFYLVLLGCFYILPHIKRKRAVQAAVLLCLALQFIDMRPAVTAKRDKTAVPHEEKRGDLDDPSLINVLGRYKHITATREDVLDEMDYAYFAVRHGLTLNRFYFARNIDSLVEQELELERERIIKGDARGDCIYVMKKDNIAAWMCPELYYYDLRGSIICVRDPVPGLLPYEAGLPARPDAGEKKP